MNPHQLRHLSQDALQVEYYKNKKGGEQTWKRALGLILIESDLEDLKSEVVSQKLLWAD